MAIEINVPGEGDTESVTSGAFTTGQGTGANTDVTYSGPFGNFTLTADQIAAAQAAAGGGAGATTGPNTASSVAANADTVGGVNVADTSASILDDPLAFLTGNNATVTGSYDAIDPNATGTNLSGSDYNIDVDGLTGTATDLGGAATADASTYTAATGDATTVSDVVAKDAITVDTVTTEDAVKTANANLKAATAEVSEDALVDVDTFDMKGLATGVNEDGSINEVGKALNTVYTQNISNVVDTSTVSGKMLAARLGEGNYLDAKATVTGQLKILSEDFVDPVTGQTKIPPYAAAALKGVNRMIAFKGVSGTAAMASVAAATMESILPIAEAESKIFSTFVMENMDAKNAQALNTANILSRMNMADLDARMTQAVTNAKTFMAYDLANLDNEQQMAVLRGQFTQQSILEDAKQENVTRRFNAESQMEMDKFYDNLGAQIAQYNASQIQQMTITNLQAQNNAAQFSASEKNRVSMFNVGQVNQLAMDQAQRLDRMTQFNMDLENNREQFYVDMQYQVDNANAKWRQSVTLQNNENAFNAAAIDVRNIVNLTSEQLNQLWDRADSLLDYAWREGENEKDRENRIAIAKLQAEAQRYAARKEMQGGVASGIGNIIGSVVGKMLPFSDERLKEDIEVLKVMPNGVEVVSWRWNDKARSLGLSGIVNFGVIAQQIKDIIPHAVILDEDTGYYKVNYAEVF